MPRPLLALILLAMVGGLSYWNATGTEPANDSHLTLYGNVEIREARLAFNGSEHLAQILAEEGDRVKAGQVLARLDTELLQKMLEQAKAQVQARQAQLDKLLAGSRPEEIAAAQAKVEASQAQARAARDTWQRLQRLLKRKLTSAEEVELARANAEAAAAEVEAARQNLRLMQAGPRAEDITAARAEAAAARAAMALAAQRLEDAVLKAPFDGVVRDRLAEPGEFVTPQNPVLSLARISPVWVRAYLPEPDLGRVRPGMGATLHTDSYPDKAYRGWVGFISPTAEFTPKNVETPELRTRLVYEMRVFACNPDGELRLGMPATVVLDLQQPAGAGPQGPERCGQ
ncbi:MAG: HlyD family efflux transporter periplasmic adaptor subunit [Gammaproteobacteria bacterium]|nr:MAG: HlyD family efflux transporter periplasmic adaptor subunit [Gammaproteobacteria bacterium]